MKKTIIKGIVFGLTSIITMLISGVLIVKAMTVLNNVEKGEILTASTLNGIIDWINNEGINKADKSDVVNLSGDQIISGNKNFENIKLNGKCIDSGVYGESNVKISNSTNNSYNISFNVNFIAPPVVTFSLNCYGNICGGLDSDGHQVTNLTKDGFQANWIDRSGSSGVDKIYWIAIGDC